MIANNQAKLSQIDHKLSYTTLFHSCFYLHLC